MPFEKHTSAIDATAHMVCQALQSLPTNTIPRDAGEAGEWLGDAFAAAYEKVAKAIIDNHM